MRVLPPTANPPCMKRLSSVGYNEPAPKKPPTPLDNNVLESQVRTKEDQAETNTTYSHVVMFLGAVQTALN